MKKTAIAVSFVLPISAWAASANGPDSGIEEDFLICSTLSAEAVRLVCFDAVAGDTAAGNRAAGIETCAAMADDGNRLTCFDAAAVQFAAGDDESASDPAAAVPAAATVTSETKPHTDPADKAERDVAASFGAEQLATPRQNSEEHRAASEKLKAFAQRVVLGHRDRYIFYLDNGQVWQQTETSRLAVPKGRPVEIEIVRGAISGYRLRVAGEKKLVRVKRVK